ncbi:transcription antitermination factor NusB [Lachnospiraceae bacterium 54-53]
MTRSKLREHCFKMLFCADFHPAEEKEWQIIQYFEEPKEDDRNEKGVEEIIHDVDMSDENSAYLKEKAEAVMTRIPELDIKINEVAEGWKTKRMGKAELTILRLALYEILYDEDVPEKVAINEAVELAKKYGGNEAPAFINGVLAKLV